MRLTLFACPKRLDGGHVETIQRNAITSWTLLPAEPEVILFGDESTARLASELETGYSDRLVYTPSGAPLLDGLFAAVEELATGDVLAYVNADIVLMADFAQAAARVSSRRRAFLMVGRRTDLDVREPLDFTEGWVGRLRDRAAREGRLHSHQAIDYFVYRPGLWGEIPPLAVGRPAFDNWLLRRARESGAALVDATPAVTAIHQNHDYGHVAGGRATVWGGPDAARNLEHAGGHANLLFVHDATHVLTPKLLLPALAPRYLRRRWERLRETDPRVRYARRAVLRARLRLARLTGKAA